MAPNFLIGLLLPILAYFWGKNLAALVFSDVGSMRWLGAMVAVFGVVGAVAAAIGGGRAALYGSVAGFVLARLSVGGLSGDGGLWYVVFVPCLLVMLGCAGVTVLFRSRR